MKHTIKCMFTALALLLAANVHAEQDPYNCLTINQDFNHIIQAKKHGLYREAMQSSSAQYQFDQTLAFSEYLNISKALIEARNPHAQRPCPISTPVTQVQQRVPHAQVVSDLIAPFELRQPNNHKAILLIHGLTDSPYLFHDLAGYFYQQGFNVRTILLPGHGTAPSDLAHIKMTQWQHSAEYAIERTLTDFEQVYLGGFSTGGALIFDYLMYQAQVSDKIKGLLMWSPASQAKSEQAWLAKYVAAIPFVTWLDKDADVDFAKYESFSFNAGAQVYSLMNRIEEKQFNTLNRHDIPLLLIASEVDQTIETRASLKLAKFWYQNPDRRSQKQDKVIYYGQRDKAQPLLDTQQALVIPSCKQTSLCAQVKEIAHTSPTNSPSNPHYGVDGVYRNCGHYLSKPDLYQACKTQEQVNVGETTADNIQAFSPIKRLTFNPYYPHMLASIGEFIQ
ncbi:alpha/beta hydrolase [Pseudoalteromonas ulvae]|uniref:Lysophospholipase n=1 Tax=Pseudoalteromonas ulvae TaxID=107327 RepID=A0A244CNR9_PSEDV|nr:alpha/beta fold hydrolase [Pseudoalteromonas ulvae]OUL57242.1 lysophospholipase [Pseudoalteromonas ulvae]